MALMNRVEENVNVEGVQPQVKSNKNGSDFLNDKGNAILASKTEEEKAVYGSKSHTLHFQALLGLNSKKSTRRVSANETKDCATPVGVELISDEPISVPVIDITLGKDTGITPDQISSRQVQAGEKFVLSYYEFMYLIIRDEYACRCSNGDIEDGIFFTAKMPSFLKGKTKLPTPTINMKDESIKKSIVPIDEKDAEGNWYIKEPYAEKFSPLLRKQTPKRSAGAKTSIPKSTLVAVALQEILGVK